MAIWQFHLTLLPKKAVLDTMGLLPENLPIDLEQRREYREQKKAGLVPDVDAYQDALARDWWANTPVQPIELTHRIDRLVWRTKPGDDLAPHWKTYTPEKDNDAAMTINAETGRIESLSFRADLREEGLVFLKAMVRLAKQYDCLLMDALGNLAEPEPEAVRKLITRSHAFRFLQDPLQFLDDLASGSI